MGIKKLPAVLGVVLVGIFLSGIITFSVATDNERKRAENERLSAYMEESYEYRMARQKLTIEYENIEKYTLERLADGAYLGIVFRGVEKQLYTSVFPMMHDRPASICGVICLNEGALPGDDGMITALQYEEIIAAGWDTALYYNGECELEEFLVNMEQVLTNRGFEMPKSVVFEKDTYISAYDTVLYNYGIANALHHGDDRQTIIEGDVEGRIWHPGVLAWNTKGFSATMLRELVSVSGIAYFEVAFDGSFQLLFDENETNRVEAFKRMLAAIEKYILEDRLCSLPIADAKQGRMEYLSCKESLLEEIAIRREEISLEIAELDKKISEIYKKHNSK